MILLGAHWWQFGHDVGGLLVVVCCWNGLICLAVLLGSVVSLFIAARDQQLDCGDTYSSAKSKIIKAQGR